MEEERKQVEISQFKCSSCGNNLEFYPGTTKLVCPYCGNEEEIDGLMKADEESLTKDLIERDIYDDDVEVFRCENCGSVSEVQKGYIAFTCPYCKKGNVVKLEDIKGIKPTGVIPFRIKKKEASLAAKTYVKKRFFASRGIKKADFDTVLSGVYSPLWTFDAETESYYNGRVGKYVTRVTGSGKNRRTVTEIRWRHVSGQLKRNFDDIKISARENVMGKNVSNENQFDTNNAAKYDKRLLAGFSAMHYEKPIAKAFTEAKQVVKDSLLDEIKSIHNADVMGEMNLQTSYVNVTYKYILIPFYIGNFMHKAKSYPLIVNGFSGKTWAKYPLSPVKVTLAVILGLALIAAIAYFAFTYYSEGGF